MRSYELTSPVELKLQHSNPKSTRWIREQNWLFLKLRIFGRPLDSLISPAKLIKHVNVTAICCGLQASKLSPVDRVKHRDIYRVRDIKIYNFYHHSHSLSFNHYQEIFQDKMMATQRWKEKPKLSKWHFFHSTNWVNAIRLSMKATTLPSHVKQTYWKIMPELIIILI